MWEITVVFYKYLSSWMLWRVGILKRVCKDGVKCNIIQKCEFCKLETNKRKINYLRRSSKLWLYLFNKILLLGHMLFVSCTFCAIFGLPFCRFFLVFNLVWGVSSTKAAKEKINENYKLVIDLFDDSSESVGDVGWHVSKLSIKEQGVGMYEMKWSLWTTYLVSTIYFLVWFESYDKI